MRDEDKVEEAIGQFQDHQIDHDQLYDKLVAAGCSPEEANEMVDIECDAADD